MIYIKKAACIDGNYRYSLTRIWDESRLRILWIMLNPSTADADRNDATIRKIVKISNNNGFGGLYVGNVYAYRTKNPNELFKDPEIAYSGSLNWAYIGTMASKCSHIIMACGRKARKIDIEDILNYLNRKIYCLGYNKDGTPVHPLYQKDNSTFQVYDINRLEGK